MGSDTLDELFHYNDDPSMLQIIVHVLLWLAVGTLVLVTLYYLCRCACCNASGEEGDEAEEERQVIVRQYSLPSGHTVPGSSSDAQNFRILQEYEYLEFLEWQQQKKQLGQNYQSFPAAGGAGNVEHYQQMSSPPGYAMPTAPPPPYSPSSAGQQQYMAGQYVGPIPSGTTNDSLQRR
ncbi:uncharacterized protein LOC141914273 [Tubulanus polymorphus]|uniref:uncharacterized protein LOC141914273 n=1 Tax=Tubulanus polymorphus TaxID=672921 RepID=UPI003DA24A1D